MTGIRWFEAAGLACLVGCQAGEAGPEAQARSVADAVHAVVSADRETYAADVVNRLQNQDRVLAASQRWREERALPLPAQMLRMGAERARKRTDRFTYALRSTWPINKQNGPLTPIERTGLDAVRAQPDQPQYAREELAGVRYLTAVYADRAVSPACVDCHNRHLDSPRHDFKVGEVMGGVVVRVVLP